MRLHEKQKGFSLIELMTAVSIFAIVMFISFSAILNIFDANRKGRAIRTAMTNLDIAIEEMSKEMRYGTKYHCGSTGNQTTPQSCPSGDAQMSFLSSDNQQITYRLNGTMIEKKVDNENYAAILSPDVFVDYAVLFYTTGAVAGDGLQPRVFIRIKGHAGAGKGRSDFFLQTLVTQRAFDS